MHDPLCLLPPVLHSIAMTFLLLVELSAFMSTQTESRVAVDFNTERQVSCLFSRRTFLIESFLRRPIMNNSRDIGELFLQFLCGLVNGDVSSDDGVILFVTLLITFIAKYISRFS